MEQPHFLSFFFFPALPTPPDGALTKVCLETKAKFDNSCCSLLLSFLSVCLSVCLSLSLSLPPLSLSLLFQRLPNIFSSDTIFLPVRRINASSSNVIESGGYCVADGTGIWTLSGVFQSVLEEKIPETRLAKKYQYPLTDMTYIFNIFLFGVLGIFPKISAILIRKRYMVHPLHGSCETIIRVIPKGGSVYRYEKITIRTSVILPVRFS